MPTIELTPPLRSPKILDGSLWREVLGPELSEQLIAQAWDDVKHGRHKVSAASANKEELWVPW